MVAPARRMPIMSDRHKWAVLSSREIYISDFYTKIFGRLGFRFSDQTERSENILGEVLAQLHPKHSPC